jgi:hypothetical protein
MHVQEAVATVDAALREIDFLEAVSSEPTGGKTGPRKMKPLADAEVLGKQARKRVRRLRILGVLPQANLQDILDEFDPEADGTPDFSTISKDVTDLRAAGWLKSHSLELTPRGKAGLRKNR